MKIQILVLLSLPTFLLTSTVLNLGVYAAEERKVLSRNYVGLGVEVSAPYQCYPGEIITVRVRLEPLEDLRNASVTMFIWGSKSEGYSPWGTSFTVLDVTDFPNGMIKEEGYDVEIPSDISPGLAYGILSLQWSIYRSLSWEDQWDKASFRVAYVKNKDYEDLQTTYNELQGSYNSVTSDLQNTKTLMYLFVATTIALTLSTVYFAREKSEKRRK